MGEIGTLVDRQLQDDQDFKLQDTSGVIFSERSMKLRQS